MIVFSTGVSVLFEPQTKAEWVKARDDYEWFAARWVPIADKEVALPHSIILNSTQRHLKWYFETFRNEYGGGNFLVYKGRQFGCSTLIDTMFAHQALKSPGFKSFIFANESSAADNLLSIVRRPYWKLPQGYQIGDGAIINIKPEEHRSNKKELWVYFDGDKTLESHIVIEEATAGATAGVGHTANAIHFSEVGKDEFDDGLAIGTSMQTLSRDAMVFAEGTPNGAYGWMYNTWQDVWDEFNDFRKSYRKNPSLKWNGWVPIFLPWFWHYGYKGGLRFPLREGEVIKPENTWEENMMEGIGTHMGYRCTPENIKAMRYLWENRIKPGASEVGLTAEEYRSQEYPSNPEEGFIQSGSTFFSKDIIREGLRFSREFMRKHTPDKYGWGTDGWTIKRDGELKMLKDPDPSRFKYTIGGDCAEGKEGNDWDTLTITEVRPDTPNQVIGYWRAHQDDKYVHALMVKDLADWVRASTVAIEGDKFGHTVNDHLRRLGCRGLYVATPDDAGSFAAGYNKSYGWTPNVKTRSIMLGELQAALRKWYDGPTTPNFIDGVIIPFPEIWTEIQAFVKMKGKGQATRGAHDDLVISTGISVSMAQDTTPKKAIKPKSQIDKMIAYYKQIGMGSAVKFYKGLKKANG